MLSFTYKSRLAPPSNLFQNSRLSSESFPKMSDKSTSAGSIAEPKGKGKAQEPPHDVSMDEDDSSDEETGAEEEVRLSFSHTRSY